MSDRAATRRMARVIAISAVLGVAVGAGFVGFERAMHLLADHLAGLGAPHDAAPGAPAAAPAAG